jgi:hypothetical protein
LFFRLFLPSLLPSNQPRDDFPLVLIPCCTYNYIFICIHIYIYIYILPFQNLNLYMEAFFHLRSPHFPHWRTITSTREGGGGGGGGGKNRRGGGRPREGE